MARRKSDAEFESFADSYAHQLRATAYLLCGNWHTAEDLTQTTLIKIYLAWSRLNRRGELHGYARQVLLRSYLDLRRRASSTEVPVDELPAEPSATGSTVDVDEGIVLARALATLSPIQRSVLVLRYWEDQDVATISRLLDLPEGTVKSHCSRGLAGLRTALSHLGVSSYLGMRF
jgi:RNA polymerase sigma-70 factor (sigma-E family)